MPITFDVDYFSNNIHGYWNYRNYPHFATRAAWLNTFMIANGYTHITILGAGYGYLIKALVENHGFTTSTVLGIENSSYAIAQANALGYGITQGYMTQADIRTHVYGATDLVVSWNVLDCLDNLTDVQNAIYQINDISKVAFIHVACFSEDPATSNYNASGYFLPSFLDTFNAMEMSPQDDSSYLIRYNDGYTYRIIRQGGSKLGTPYTGLNVPLCWGLEGD